MQRGRRHVSAGGRGRLQYAEGVGVGDPELAKRAERSDDDVVVVVIDESKDEGAGTLAPHAREGADGGTDEPRDVRPRVRGDDRAGRLVVEFRQRKEEVLRDDRRSRRTEAIREAFEAATLDRERRRADRAEGLHEARARFGVSRPNACRYKAWAPKDPADVRSLSPATSPGDSTRAATGESVIGS